MYRFLRWLLVAVLPFLGLYLGSRLTPEIKPVWEVSFPEMMVCLGVVDEGRTVLLSERGTTISKDKELTIVGIDATTGTELFHHTLPEETRQARERSTSPLTLTSDGDSITFYNNDGKRNTNIVLYDWKRQEIVRRYRCLPKYLNTIDAVLKKNTLAASTWYFDAATGKLRSFIVVWDAQSDVPKWHVEVGETADCLSFSDDGKVAAICTTTTKQDELVLVDTLRGTIIQKIPGYRYQEVRWSSDSQRMHIVNSENDAVYIQHYERQSEQYLPTTRDLVSQPPVEASHDNKYVALRRYIGSTPFRRRLQEMFNSQLNAILDHLWPVRCMISLHDLETGETIRSMSLPQTQNPGPLYPANNLEGVIIPNGKTLTYWSFTPIPIWPQYLGLFIGVLLASLLAWSTLRRSPRKAI